MTFAVTILGSSSALPTSKRYPSAHVLNAHERLFLIDCGEGTQMQLRKFKLRLSRINSIFISHVHGDHSLGLFGLISTLNLLGRKQPLTIYAHESLRAILNQFIQFFVIDLLFPLNFIALNPKSHEVIYEDDKITVESFPLKHRIASNGFLFKEKPKLPNIKKETIEQYGLTLADIVSIKNGNDYQSPEGSIISNAELTYTANQPRSYAYCSDTQFYPRMTQYIQNVDLLYHEATFDSSLAKMAKMVGHSTAAQAAEIAKLANAKRLAIGHFSSRYKEVTSLLDEAQQIFPQTYAVEDGDTFHL